MTKTEVSLLLSYLYNQECRLEDSYNAYLQQLRFHSVGLNDIVECLVLRCELEQFQQISKDIRMLLSLKRFTSEESEV